MNHPELNPLCTEYSHDLCLKVKQIWQALNPFMLKKTLILFLISDSFYFSTATWKGLPTQGNHKFDEGHRYLITLNFFYHQFMSTYNESFTTRIQKPLNKEKRNCLGGHTTWSTNYDDFFYLNYNFSLIKYVNFVIGPPLWYFFFFFLIYRTFIFFF